VELEASTSIVEAQESKQRTLAQKKDHYKKFNRFGRSTKQNQQIEIGNSSAASDGENPYYNMTSPSAVVRKEDLASYIVPTEQGQVLEKEFKVSLTQMI